IFASTSLSPSALPPRREAAFNSWARSLIAARSSFVNPLLFFPGFVSAIVRSCHVASVGARHAENVLRDVGKDEVVRDRRNRIEPCLAELALAVVLCREAEAPGGCGATRPPPATTLRMRAASPCSPPPRTAVPRRTA